MLTLNSENITEKNKLSSTGAWLILLEINFLPNTTIRICYNKENIVWPTGGETWQAFPFKIEEISEDGKGGLPTFSIRVSNVTRSLEPYIEESNGGIGATVTIKVVHSDHLDLTTPELDETFDNLSCSVNSKWVTFRLGGENPMRKRSPKDRYLQDHCRYAKFKGTLCGYSGPEVVCNRSFIRCKELLNIARFGNCPGVGGGVYINA